MSTGTRLAYDPIRDSYFESNSGSNQPHESSGKMLSGHQASLIHLPVELLQSILSYLPNRDIKILRQTCLTLCRVAHLRLKRVFLSANPRNIEVLRAIADHDIFRHNIVELIWDDARLIGHDDVPEPDYDPEWEDPPGSYKEIPCWFEEAYEKNIQTRELWSGKNPETQPSIHVSWEYYHELLQQQKNVLEFDDDVKAFRYALERFPNLRRVTITPATHGVLDVPLYETPMIRSFPPDFNYPIQYTWPEKGPKRGTPYILQPWSQEKMKWRGFCVAINELSQIPTHNISEFVVDVHTVHMAGLSCRLFDQPCEEYDNLVSLVQRPGFSHLHLTLKADGQWTEEQAWSSFRSGLFQRMLSAAPSDLRHFSLQVNVDYHQARHRFQLDDAPFDPQHFISLKTILPAVKEKWKKLQHFGLSGFLVQDDELFEVLTDLPVSVRSIELSFLEFMGRDTYKSYNNLFANIRDKLDWGKRKLSGRPVLTVHERNLPRNDYLCYDKVVNDFLYHDGLEPFRRRKKGDPAPFRVIKPFKNATAPVEILE